MQNGVLVVPLPTLDAFVGEANIAHLSREGHTKTTNQGKYHSDSRKSFSVRGPRLIKLADGCQPLPIKAPVTEAAGTMVSVMVNSLWATLEPSKATILRQIGVES